MSGTAPPDRPRPLSDEEYRRRLAGLPPRPLSETARRVLETRYLRRDSQGALCESHEGLLRRVADHAASAEPLPQRQQVADTFYGMMAHGEFLPNSPTLMNAGLPQGQLAACFVLPVGDSIGAIFDAVKNMALVQKTGGGTGFSFSTLRPAGDEVSSTKGISSGPLTFMEVFNAATDTIKQGGRRRGANMGVLEVHHPDVLRFITEKADPARLTNFNLSVGLTEAFMESLDAGSSFALINPRTGEQVGALDARQTLRLLARCAWHSGEPGVLFLDRINAANPTPQLGRIESTNPCGELPLLPFESCNLGSVNLEQLTHGGEIDWPALGAAVRWGVRFLDNVIDTTAFPMEQVAKATLATRKIGLGVMGFADLLIRLGIGYGEDRVLPLAREIMGHIAAEARRASEGLAAQRGPFPAFADGPGAADGERPRRNATLTTIAPTGTLSILAGCSAGIEPIFAPAYRRRFLDGQTADELHPLFAEHLKARGLHTDEVIRQVAEAGSARVGAIPDELRRLFVTAHEIPARRHVEIQAAFQQHVDNSVSKTVNLPADATVERVEEVIRLAHRLGCKGITVYRDASRSGQVLSTGASPKPFPTATPRSNEICPACGAALARAGPFWFCGRCAWSSAPADR